MEFHTHTAAQTVELGKVAGRAVCPDTTIVLCGDLGAGKTQFTKGIANGLGIEEAITSPTFNIILTHTSGRIPLYHFDLYRLGEPDQLIDIGYDDLLEAGGVSVIEWGDRFPEALPQDHLDISFSLDGEQDRTLSCKATGPLSQELLHVLEQTVSSDVSEGGE